MAEREPRLRTEELHDLLVERIEIALVEGEVVDVTFARIPEVAVG